MTILPDLVLNQAQLITFVLINAAGVEVAGLGAVFNLSVSKAGGGFVPGTGAKAEIGNGWYSYLIPAGEVDTPGPLSFYVSGVGTIQQNLVYTVATSVIGGIEFTYTVTNSVTLAPLDGVEIWVTTDIAGSNVIWNGSTDALGVARDDMGNKPRLDAGTYYFWRQLAGFTFVDPDTEIVS